MFTRSVNFFAFIWFFLSIFFGVFSFANATDSVIQSGISNTILVSKNFSKQNGNFSNTGSNFFWYNDNGLYGSYIRFLSGSYIYGNWEGLVMGRYNEKHVYQSDNSIITLIVGKYTGMGNGDFVLWTRQDRQDDRQESELGYKTATCGSLFAGGPAYGTCTMYSFPLRFHSGSVIEYGVGLASIDYSGNKSTYAWYIPDIGSPSYIEGQDPILINSPIVSIAYSNAIPKRSGSFYHYSGYWGTYTSDFMLVVAKGDWIKSYNPYDSGINMIEWNDSDNISSSNYAAISSGIPSGFTDTTYCRTNAGYDIMSYYDRATGSGVSFSVADGSATELTDGKICLTDIYPDSIGAYVGIDNAKLIKWNGGPLIQIVGENGAYVYASGSELRYNTDAMEGFNEYPGSGGGGSSVDIGYSPGPSGYDCKPVYFASGSSDGIHIDIPTDQYIYMTGTTTGPPPNSSYNAQLFASSDASNIVNVTVKPYYTTLSNVLSGSVIGTQSGSYTSVSSSTDYATFAKTGIPLSGVEFSAKVNGDLANIGRVVFSTNSLGFDQPLSGTGLLGYAVFYNANGTYDVQNIRKISSGTGEVRSSKGGQIVQIVGLAGFSFSHVDLYRYDNDIIKKYECMNSSFSCYWSRSITGSFACGGKINPIYGNEIGSCISSGDYCQPSSVTGTGKLDPFNYIDNGIIRPVYNQSGSVSGIAYNSGADDIFTCSYDGISVLLCVPEILGKIWKRFTVALKNILDFLYSIGSIGSPSGSGSILGFFVEKTYAYDAGESLRLPYYTTATGAKIQKESFTGTKNPIGLNSSIATMGDNVNNLPDGGLKGIFAFAIYATLLIVLFVVVVLIASSFSNK